MRQQCFLVGIAGEEAGHGMDPHLLTSTLLIPHVNSRGRITTDENHGQTRWVGCTRRQALDLGADLGANAVGNGLSEKQYAHTADFMSGFPWIACADFGTRQGHRTSAWGASDENLRRFIHAGPRSHG
jgi:hypothetical protein